MNPLLQLIDYGQSYWLDNLSRAKIRGGELRRRVSEEGLRGLTSNPAIFNKAISATTDYDDQLRQLVAQGRLLPELYEQIVVADIRDACDILRPVYEQSSRVDGLVSLEVSPILAHNAEESVTEARHLFELVDRPNVMIKIPGTPAGVSVVEELLFEGVNINITLLFSIESYEAVAWAYIRALERRLAAGRSVDGIASVASFFLSRIDTLVDRLLTERMPSATAAQASMVQGLLGKTAVSNAKLAYQRFKQILASERWQALESKGAQLQRMLWASTSTKNPRYSDVMYVEPLIGRHTVNTMPDETITAFADHGIVRASIEEGLEQAQRVMRDLDLLGVDFRAITDRLLQEGIDKFTEPYEALLQTLAAKRQQFLPEWAGG
jgi:transaldolase